MNKRKAIDVLNQIASTCQPLNVGGFYTRPFHPSPDEEVELMLRTSLDPVSREKLAPLISGQGLNMREEKGIVIIYDPRTSDRKVDPVASNDR